ncbi:uncharacterized protein LOC125561258 [Nematostella vectensis]|uniref:uncharacterized protein LOC125561258 n=1 Tax=Nematostella vectensis TaxID=45351 RepID=UPI002076F66E|nr:uncharacterized protein LOC125561258 [Nematostella vectensis]
MFSHASSAISQQVVVLGDLNFDLLERPLPAPIKQYLSIFDSLGYQQLITKSTRPISNSLWSSHIFVSSSDFVIESDTVSNTANDHLPIFVAWKLRAGYSRPTGHKVLRFRSRKNFCTESFMHDLSLVPWSTLDIYDDVNDALDQWYKLFNDILTVHAPIKEHRIKRPLKLDWFNAEISAAIKARNCLHRIATSLKTDTSWSEYRRARNHVHLIRKAKKTFYNDAIKNNLENPKNLWKIIRKISPSKHVNLPNRLTVNDTLYEDTFDIANSFNKHFSNISSQVSIDAVPEFPDWSVLTNFINSKHQPGSYFSIPPISEDFVLNSLSRLDIGKAAGLDELNGFFYQISSS